MRRKTGAQCILPQDKYLERKKTQAKSVLVLERTSKRQAYHTVLLAWSQHNPSNGSRRPITPLQTEPGVQWQVNTPTQCGCLDAKQQQNRSLLWSLPQLSYPAQHGSPSYFDAPRTAVPATVKLARSVHAVAFEPAHRQHSGAVSCTRSAMAAVPPVK